MVLSGDPCKDWLLQKACKGLDVPETYCESLLEEDQPQLDMSTFLAGGSIPSRRDHCKLCSCYYGSDF